MTGLRIGALFAGYGGLTKGVQAAVGGTVAWVSDIDPGASKILAHRYPGVPNLGDITTIDWTTVPPVDVIEGGSPCQDVSHAGSRAGMRTGTRSGLWSAMRDAIDIIRPRLVVWENVRGVLSAQADSDVEPCPFCVGDERGPTLRALGRVVGDLAELGYVGGWHGLRAADVGAPHPRFRVFVVAWPATDADRVRSDRRRVHGPRQWGGTQPADRGLAAAHASDRRLSRHAEFQFGAEAGVQAPLGGHVDGLAVEARGLGGDNWGPFGPAIHRWERLLGRPSPAPTEPGRNGQPRLSPRFVEFLMGLPAGWVTDVPGLSRNEQLKALGNGVVWQQSAAGIRHILRTAHTQRGAA